jgi:hypothetical protein
MTSWSWPRAPKAAPPSKADAQKYRVGLQLLEKIRRRDEGQEEWIQFVSLILYACEKAIAWRLALSEPAYRLANFTEFRDDLRSILNGLEKNLKFSNKHRYIFDIGASYAQDSIGLTDEVITEAGIVNFKTSLTRRLVQALVSEFNRPHDEIRYRYLKRWNGDAGIQMMRVAGPLCFPEIVEDAGFPI